MKTTRGRQRLKARRTRKRGPRVFLGTPSGSGQVFPADAFPDRAFESPTRSLIPLIAYWSSPVDRLRAVRKDIGGPEALDSADLCFDYPVASAVPHHASFTDLMLLASKAAVSFSANWTEPMPETIDKWRHGRPPGRAKAILDGWFTMLSTLTRRKTSWQPDDDSLVYEMVQRVSSLSQTHKAQLHLVYQLFGGWHEREYEAALSRLTQRIGKRERIAIWMQTVPVTPLPPFEGLRKRWRELPPASRAYELRELLLEGRAFHFGEPTWLRFV